MVIGWPPSLFIVVLQGDELPGDIVLAVELVPAENAEEDILHEDVL